jgi:mRNA-degrading endonuclease RelE of RelBE toxin-antitoxin system
MSYEVVLSSAAQRDLDALPPNLLTALQTAHLPRIAADPRAAGRPKKGRLAGIYGYDFGPRRGYRVLYEVVDARRIVLVLAIGPHDQAYRRAERRT